LASTFTHDREILAKFFAPTVCGQAIARIQLSGEGDRTVQSIGEAILYETAKPNALAQLTNGAIALMICTIQTTTASLVD